MTTEIRKTIRDYLGKWKTTDDPDALGLFTIGGFVGMVETGEATLDDFQAVGGDNLAAAVARTLRHMQEAREDC